MLRKEKADALERTLWAIDYLLPFHRVYSEQDEDDGLGPAFHQKAVEALETIQSLVAKASNLALAQILTERLSDQPS